MKKRKAELAPLSHATHGTPRILEETVMSKPEGQVVWVEVVLMPASFPFWPPRDAGAKGFQGCSPAVDADVQGRD